MRSGTLTIETAGDSGATVVRKIPDSDGVQQLIAFMIEEDADRRADGAGYGGDGDGHPDDDYGYPPEDGWRSTAVL